YRKDTGTNNLLHAKSQHPNNFIQGIPTGQYLRIKRICITTEEFKIEAKKLYDRFKDRGYSHNCLKKAYQRALEKEENTKVVRLIGDYNLEHKDIYQILCKHWHILEQDRDLRKIIGNKPQVTYRRSKNLRDKLVQSHFTHSGKSTWLSNRNNGCYRCGDCLACLFVIKTTIFLGREDIAKYSIKQFINCKMRGVIYVMECKCGKRYVGKSKREFRRRILEHGGDVRHKRNTSIANHNNELHNGNTGAMKFTANKPTTRIGDIDRKLLQSEAKWIYWLNSKSPNGLNEGFTFTPFL
ncbi:hypothetical protein XELAEV_18005911mg, partial [Xenopus laevis]